MVVRVPSLTVAYHSKVWPAPRLAQTVAVFVPDATPLFCPIWVKLPLARGRPNQVTVSGSLLGSETPMLSDGSDGDVTTPVAPLAGAFRVGAFGAVLLPAAQRGPTPILNR